MKVLNKKNIEDIFALTPMQEMILVYYLKDPAGEPYFEQLILEISGAIDPDVFERSWNLVIETNEMLRAVFRWEKVDNPIQIILKEHKLQPVYYDFSASGLNEKKMLLEEVKVKDRKKKFDLREAETPFRVTLCKVEEAKYEMIISNHHILYDGWSNGILLKEFFEAYNALAEGKELTTPVKTRFKEFVRWIQSLHSYTKTNKREEFWRNYLKGFDTPTELLIRRKRKEREETKSFRTCFAAKDLKDKIGFFARNRKVSAASVLHSAWGILLQRYSNSDDVVFGTVVSGRSAKMQGIEDIVGLFINTLPMRVQTHANERTEDLVHRIDKALQMKAEYEVASLVKIKEYSRVDTKKKLFNSVLVLENYPLDRRLLLENNKLSIDSFSMDEKTHYDLGVRLTIFDDIEFYSDFNNQLFDEDIIGRLCNHFRSIVENIVKNPGIEVSAIEMLCEEDRDQVLFHFNNGETKYCNDKTIHELFEKQVEKTPDNTAVAYEEKQLTYKELDEKADRLAKVLVRKGVKTGDIVAIMVDPSLEMLIGILGILKAGGAYLPLDPGCPRDRMSYMLEDTRASLLLTKLEVLGGKSFTRIQNLNNINREQAYVTVPRMQITDIESIGIPDRSSVNYEKYNQYLGQSLFKHYIAIQATRGCPYKCVYCHKIWPKTHVIRSARHIFEEVKLYYDMGVRRFTFIDDIFNLNIKNSRRFFELVIENELDIQISFPNGIRGDILTREYIDLMIKAGTIHMAFALETASPRLQKLIKKNVDLEKLEENIRYVSQKYPHVITELFTMHGFPTETEEEALMTLNFIKSIKWIHFPYVFILRVFPNSDMEKLALESGISRKAIMESADLYYHDLPTTLPFDNNFTRKYQVQFINEYFLSKERLLDVLPHQLKVLSEDEIVQKYNSYLPTKIFSLTDLLDMTGIREDELDTRYGLNEDNMAVPGLNEKIRRAFPGEPSKPDALRILLLDLSQFFSSASDQLNQLIEPPLGLMYLLTYLKRKLGCSVTGKIAKAYIDFDTYDELRVLLEEFKPDVIGVRSLSIYKDFFHKTISLIRQWGYDVPVIVGGPYPTSEYNTILQDKNIDCVVLGEGEDTFLEIIGKIMENGKKLPGKAVLRKVAGIAFNPNDRKDKEAYSREIMMLDDARDIPVKENPWSLKRKNDAGSPAYVIYTSGSTGKPKGVPITHANISPLLHWGCRHLGIGPADRTIQNLSYSFDWSVWEIFITLISGASLYLTSRNILLDSRMHVDFINKLGITVLHITPTHHYYLVDAGYPLRTLKYLFIGAEKLTADLVERSIELVDDNCRIFNMYGPTEATIISAVLEIDRSDIDRYNELSSVPIGKPVGNTALLVVDNRMRMYPIDLMGELVIAGEGLARGYLNNPELTAEKFVLAHSSWLIADRREKKVSRSGELPMSCQLSAMSYFYKTGDLAYWLPEGDIEFLGRVDHQVKIRGFRIELGEIENRLLSRKDIKEAVVIDREDAAANKFLCAYIVPGNGSEGKLDFDKIREYLSQSLPHYMIPAHFIPTANIPLTSNGKIDRKALPAPGAKNKEENYEAPRNKIEKELVEIWEGVLGVDNIGINDNFFEAGGDSIRIIQVAARMKKAGYQVEIRAIMRNPTIASLVPEVKELKISADQSVVTGIIPLTPIQKYFSQGPVIDVHHFNQAVMFYSRDGFDKKNIERVFTGIQEHHDALRMTYHKNADNGEVIQMNHGLNYPLSLREYNLKNHENSQEELRAKINEIQGGIDLENGPLLKLGLFHCEDGDRLLMVIHHLAIDTVSWRILFEDIQTLYDGNKKGEEPVLPPKTGSFKLWAENLSVYADSKAFLKEKNYWQKIVSLEVPPIPKDFAVDDNYVKDTLDVSFKLGEKETALLLKKVNKAFNTEINDILLTALGLGIKKTLGHDRAAIALEGHGREEIPGAVDISRTVGWFTSIYPVVLDISREQDTGRQLKEIKETLRKVPNKGIGYGILKYLTGEENKKGIEFKLKPQISFNYLGQFDADVNRLTFGEIARESVGNVNSLNNPRSYEIEVVGKIVDKRLEVIFYYNGRQYKPETMETLLGNFQSQLHHIIGYCASKETMEFTPGDFTYKGLRIEDIDRIMKEYPALEDLYTLTPMQEGMLFHALADDLSYSYFEQVSMCLQGELDIYLVEKSLNELFKRHDVLRTAFVYKDIGRPVQVVLRDRVIDFYYEDIRKIGAGKAKENFIEEFKEKDKARSFDLSKDALMRVSIFRVDQSTYEFTWSFHHILMDGWCLGIINREFFEIYNSFVEDRDYILPGVKPYKTYINWTEKKDRDESKEYWRDYLWDYEGKASLLEAAEPGERSKDDKYGNEEISILLTREKTAGLNKLAACGQVTLNTFIQGIWAVILSRHCSKNDVVFGAVVSGRPSALEGVETLVGLFINTIPVRIKLDRDTRFDNLLKTLHQDYIKSEPHDFVSLAEIQSETSLKHELLDHIIVFENYPMAERLEELGRDGRGIRLDLSSIRVFEQSNYNFNIVAGAGERLSIKIIYNSNVFDRDFVLRLGNHIENVMDEILENSSLLISDIQMLSEGERNRLLYDFNDTGTGYPADKTIQQLFEGQAARTPDGVAVVGTHELHELHEEGYISITYRELNQNSNQLARVLRGKGVQPDTVVAIISERSVEMIIGILGILKSGGAYMPIDPGCPGNKKRYMLEDSQAKLLLTKSKIAAATRDIPGKENPGHLKRENNPGNLAYVIYTSGSTGEPKGVPITHSNISPLLHWGCQHLGIGPADRAIQNLSYFFDWSVWEIFITLITGACLYTISKEILLDPGPYVDFIDKSGITVLHITPTHHYYLVNVGYPLKTLKHLFIGAEKLTVDLVKRSIELISDNCRIFNMYGPTEATIISAVLEIDRSDIDRYNELSSVPIGGPVGNTALLVLDCCLKICPIGVSGELYIAGDCLACGYLNNPELTAEKFDHDLWDFQDYHDEQKRKKDNNEKFLRGSRGQFLQKEPPGRRRLYKTGDLARWLPEGNIEFLGRIDQQVKIRGFRIEPGEIEKRLLEIEGITEAVVIPREKEKGEKYLCAYIVTAEEIDSADLRHRLSTSLSDYMIPSSFVRVEQIPLNPNGKVNRRALPEPEIDEGGDSIAPGNEIERKLVEIWSEVLSVDREAIGVHANFFDLGGHSLKATTVTLKIHKELNVKVPLVEIFERPTIIELSDYIKNLKRDRHESIEPAERKEYYKLSSAQKRLYTLQQMGKSLTHYNIPGILVLEGKINKEKFEDTFNRLIQRHESFRTCFVPVNDEPVQKVCDKVEFKMEYHDAEVEDGELEELIIENFVHPFDLSRAPLLRVGLIRLEEEKHLLMVDMHHIISDGVSQEIFIREFRSLYAGKDLPPLRLQYKDYSQWQDSKAQKEKAKAREQFWLSQLAGALPVLNLPLDYERPWEHGFEGSLVNFTLSPGETRNLGNMARVEGVTDYILLLTIFYVFLYKLTGQETIIVGTDAAGRRHADLENICGMFINTLALINYPTGDKTFRNFLHEIKNRTLEVFENQEYQFDDLVEKLRIKRDGSRNPIFDVFFSYQNFGKQAVGAPELDIAGLKQEPYELKNNTSHFDLMLTVSGEEEQLLLSFSYSTRLFKENTINRFINYFKRIISEVIMQPEKKLSELRIMSSEDKSGLLKEIREKKCKYLIPSVPVDSNRNVNLEAEFDF
jgi:amino acid adenylation domain-containing protein/non-ribosomal peptide synthase protein (TIGR01720 family)